MTATMPPLGPTADTWDHSPVVAAIAAGPDWPERVAAYWSATVADKAHDLAHPRPVAGCTGCPQVAECSWCGLPESLCESPIEHDRRRRQGEVSLLVGVADYGRERSR